VVELEFIGDKMEKKPFLDMTINLGHILTFIGFMAAGISMYANLDKRVVVLEEFKTYQAKKEADQDQALKESLGDIKHRLDRIDDKLSVAAEKHGK